MRSIEFHHSIDEARKAAKPEQPTVVLFGASWCSWCRKMEADTLADPKVTTIAGQFLWVKVDVDKDQELAARYGVDGVPVAVVARSNRGASWARRAAIMPPDKFVDFLLQSLANPHPDEILPDLLDRFVKSQGPRKNGRRPNGSCNSLQNRPDRAATKSSPPSKRRAAQPGPCCWA